MSRCTYKAPPSLTSYVTFLIQRKIVMGTQSFFKINCPLSPSKEEDLFHSFILVMLYLTHDQPRCKSLPKTEQ